jgi:hypothetical protein
MQVRQELFFFGLYQFDLRRPMIKIKNAVFTAMQVMAQRCTRALRISIACKRQVYRIVAIEKIHGPGFSIATEQEHGHVSAKALQK